MLAGRIHKIHHEFKQPFGIAAVYAHPIEHVLPNLIPVAAGPAIMQWFVLANMLFVLLAVPIVG